MVAFYRGPADQKTIEATSLVIRTKADFAAIAEKEREDWQKRGTSGTVTAIDAAARTLTIKAGQKSIAVQPSEKAEFLRYAPDSAKFSDAKPGPFAEIKVGDQVLVLGDKAADGASIKAEKVLSGSFRQLAATISSVNAATGEIVIKDLASKKSLTVRVNPDTTMKKLPETTAQMLARRYGPAGGQVDAQAGPGGGAAVWARRYAWRRWRRHWADARSLAGDAALGTETRRRHHGLDYPGKRPGPRHRRDAPGGSRTSSDGFSQRHSGHHERLEPGRRRR